MTVLSPSTPLMALPAVVLDTETTGLDPRSARVIQIGAVRPRNGQVDPNDRFESLVDPEQPIPPGATAIHGLTDAHVAGAPSFAAVAPNLAAFLGDSVVIGHTIAFDMAILARAHQRAGLPWTAPRTLDVRLLAGVAFANLRQDDLDSLCTRLSVPITARHTATGDAMATAGVFLALVPLLRERGIRTLAEAEAASSRLAERMARTKSGLLAVGGPPIPGIADQQGPLERIDGFPYRHLVRDVMTAPPVSLDAAATVAQGIAILAGTGISSVFVRQGGVHAATPWGIVTERDIIRALDAQGDAALRAPLATLATMPLECVRADDFLYRAIGRMTRLGLRHLGVIDAGGDLVGALTPRNLLRQRALSAIVLGDQIDSAKTTAELGAAWARVPEMARLLLAEEVEARAIAAVISTEIRALTQRASEMAEARMVDAGLGGPPVPYCVMVLGSAGRGESLLAADQDNAIVFASGDPDGPEDRWFAAMATHMTAILDEVGVPFCQGGVMAKNAAWRLSLAGWHAQIDRWVRRQRPEDLLSVDIFFDLAPAHGDPTLAERIRAHAYDAGHAAPDFVKLLAAEATRARPPLTLFGRLRTEDGRVDLKKHGLMPIFTAARVLSIRHHLPAHATVDRLRAVLARGIGAASDIDAVILAHGLLLEACLMQQLADARAGVPLSTRVDPGVLPTGRRAILPDALRAVAKAVDLVNEGRIG